MKMRLFGAVLILGAGIGVVGEVVAAPLCKIKSGNTTTYYSTAHNLSDNIYKCVVKNGKAGRERIVGSMSASKAKAKYCKRGKPFPAGTWPC